MVSKVQSVILLSLLALCVLTRSAVAQGTGDDTGNGTDSTPTTATGTATGTNTSAEPSSTPEISSTVTSTQAPTTTTLTPEQDCALGNSSCNDCLARGVQCIWCSSHTEHCRVYPAGDIIPHSSFCPLKDARWGVCWVNYEALLITMGVLGGVILIVILCTCYCCCCRSKGYDSKKYKREEESFAQEREERRTKNDARRQERQGRMDEIRRKYGLMKDDNAYERFDA